jgi:hypothetical protein
LLTANGSRLRLYFDLAQHESLRAQTKTPPRPQQ